MPKLLVIYGQTATGKTGLALHMAKLFDGELVSADSRQVYKDLDIGTGKDLPQNSKLQIPNSIFKNKKIGFFEIDGIRVWGYDLVEPNEEFSVSQYIDIADKIIEDILKRGKLPVIVGGTGFYIKGILYGVETAIVPKDVKLREKLEGKSVEELLSILKILNPEKVDSMNSSDIKNPRRLVRAIEIAMIQNNANNENVSRTRFIETKKDRNILIVGLMAPKELLNKKIEERVIRRVDQGVEKEINGLIKSGITWNDQSMNTLAYKEWKDYFDGSKSKLEILKRWYLDEIHYAKRQITWFKKDKRAIWFDVSISNWQEEVENLVRKWYIES